MATNIAPFLRQRYFDSNGNPLAGGKLYTYQAGTTTPQATYTDSTGGTPNANPVILDADGEADVWLDTSLSYKFVLKDSTDATQWTVDNVVGLATANSISTASLQDLSVTTGKIADDAVTAAKLADSASVDGDRAVTTDHIRNLAVTRGKLATGGLGAHVNRTATATDTVLATDDTLLYSASGGSFTATLPTAVGISGRRYTFVRTDQTLANAVTIDGNGSETINGAANFKLCTQYERLVIESDNANWIIIAHTYPKKWTTYTATIGATTTPPTEGTGVTKLYMWRREADSMRVRWQYKHTGAGGGGSGAYLFPPPSGVTADTAKITASTTAGGDGGHIVGIAYVSNGTGGGLSTYMSRVALYNTTNLIIHNQEVINSITNPFGSASLPMSATNINFSFEALIPITNWEG